MTAPSLAEALTGDTVLTVQDVYKYLYQRHFGCEHAMTAEAEALRRIRAEAAEAEGDDLPEIEVLGDGFCRVHLHILNRGLKPETLCRLFWLSAEETPADREDFETAVAEVSRLAHAGQLPFSGTDWEQFIAARRAEKFPAVHHSAAYRAAHHPAYRVIRTAYARLLPLLLRLDTDESSRRIVAVDGRCASGKTTLAAVLHAVYGAAVFHMDDFFLRPEQRTPERLNTPGEFVDYERFDAEVLTPLTRGETVQYRRYDCHRGELLPPVAVPPHPLAVVEGVYCLHPTLADRYTLTVFSDIAPDEQRRRIRQRNTPETARRFFEEWIPREEAYYRALSVRERADLLLP